MFLAICHCLQLPCKSKNQYQFFHFKYYKLLLCKQKNSDDSWGFGGCFEAKIKNKKR